MMTLVWTLWAMAGAVVIGWALRQRSVQPFEATVGRLAVGLVVLMIPTVKLTGSVSVLVAALTLFALAVAAGSAAEQRRHLATTTRWGAGSGR